MGRFKSVLKARVKAWRRKRQRAVRVRFSDQLTAPLGVKLHLGCGEVNLEGWISIDAAPLPHVHLAAQGFGLASFADGAASVIYGCHCFEHLRKNEALAILSECHRVRAVGGWILLSVPDFDNLIRIYQTSGDLSRVERTILGGQDSEFNYHFQLFTRTVLEELLIEAGFECRGDWDTEAIFGVDLGDWSSHKEKVGREMVPISLNVKAIKPHE